MEDAPASPAGVFVVRVWTEDDPPRIRARVIEQVGGQEPRRHAADRPEDICRLVHDFVERLTRLRST